MAKTKIRINPIVSAQIKEIRKRRKKTQIELADMLGMSDQTIRKYESGSFGVPHSSIRAIAAALDCPIDFLLGKTNCDTVEAYTEEQRDIKETLAQATVYLEEKEREYRLTVDFLKTFLSCELKESYIKENDGSFSPVYTLTLQNEKKYRFYTKSEMEDFLMTFFEDVKVLLRYRLLDHADRH